MRCIPPLPVFDAYIEKLGSCYIFENFLDQEMKPNEACADDLRYELTHLDEIPEDEWVHPHSGISWGNLVNA